MKEELNTANETIATLTSELESLREFKLNTEKDAHKEKVDEMFSNFQLSEEDVKDLDIHTFTLEEIEEKCYAILGKKLAQNKNFSKYSGIHLPLDDSEKDDDKDEYSGSDYSEFYKNI